MAAWLHAFAAAQDDIVVPPAPSSSVPSAPSLQLSMSTSIQNEVTSVLATMTLHCLQEVAP
jgi:hypothetical protein